MISRCSSWPACQSLPTLRIGRVCAFCRCCRSSLQRRVVRTMGAATSLHSADMCAMPSGPRRSSAPLWSCRRSAYAPAAGTSATHKEGHRTQRAARKQRRIATPGSWRLFLEGFRVKGLGFRYQVQFRVRDLRFEVGV